MLRAFGAPSRYMQGPGALAQLESLSASYGAKRPFVIVDDIVRKVLEARLRNGFGSLAEKLVFARFNGECTAEEILRLGEEAASADADLLIGLGGGKAIDTAKGMRILRDCPLFIVPTIASNDSPTSRLSVLYSHEHVLHEVRVMRSNPDVVLVDTEVLISAPERFFVSGIGDAISKRFEAAQCLATGGNNFYGARPPLLAGIIADACFHTIQAHAEAALVALRTNTLSEDFERTVEATILLSGLAFENGGLSIAHSLTRGFSKVPGIASSLHGEQVAFGLIPQLILERQPASFILKLLEFYRTIGLPRTLHDLGLRTDPAAAAQVIAHDTWERAPYVRAIANPIDVDRLAAAVLGAHELGMS